MKFLRHLPFLLLSLGAPLAMNTIPAHSQSAQAQSWKFLEDEAEPQFNLTWTQKSAAAGKFSVTFDYKDAKNFYALDFIPGTVSLRSVLNGTATTLAKAPLKVAPNTAFVLKRRPWAMELIAGKTVVFTAFDATLNEGQIGSQASGGWGWSDVRVQPVEDIYWTDDFTRAPGQNGEWKPTGAWTLTSSSEESNAAGRSQRTFAERVEMSANPFAYRTQAGTGNSWAQAGRWFWDNYDAGVSVKPLARGTVGLAVYVQDPKNYIALLWSSTEGAGARRLVRVLDGKMQTLAQAPGAFLPRQWYRLNMRTGPGFVEAFIDGKPVFNARNTLFGGGQIALIAQNMRMADFDDAKVTSYAYFRQDVSGLTSGAWKPFGGTWNAQSGVLTSAPKAGENGKTRFLLTGRDDWDGYQVTAQARAGTAGAAGLVVGYRDDKNYTVFRWAGPNSPLPFKGRQQLMRYRAGKATIINDAPLSLVQNSDGFAEVSMRMAHGGVGVYDNGKLVAQTADESLVSGRPALWAQGLTTAQFRDVIMAFPPERQAPKVAPKMADDALMVGWASAAGEWPPTGGDNGIEYWNTGEFFGDASVEYSWRRAAYAGGALEMALRAQRGKFDSGYLARFEDLRDKKQLRVTLSRAGKTLKQADFDWKKLAGDDESRPVPIRVELEGRGILFSIGNKPAMTFLDNSDLNVSTHTAFGARATGFRVAARDLRASSAHRDDYTFTEAPTDWYAPQGNWSVISRWPCYADWSFFGGQGLNATLWSKRVYGGDTVVEYYAHNQMDLPKEPGYATPGNMNVTIGGDGKNPSSGYSFVVAGWDNTRSAIMRGTQVVAENWSDAAIFLKPTNHNASYHRRWYYIKAETRAATRDGKNGVLLKLTVDDVPLAEYFDPSPLPTWNSGGRVALWTLDSVMMVARAKIESQRMGVQALPTGLLYAEMPEAKPSSGDEIVARPVETDGQAAVLLTQTEEDGQRVWRAQNPQAGGLYAVEMTRANKAALRATTNTKLEFDLWQDAQTRVDAYVTIRGVKHLIQLGRAAQPDARVRVLGTSQASTESSGWKQHRFDLGAALQKLYPNDREWNIEKIEIGALHGDEYRWAGFDGNTMGATYKVRGVKLAN